MDTPSYRERLNRVLRYIENHLDDSPDLEALSAVACFSPYHFHRIFSAMVGESVAAYVRRLRLERAAMQLSLSDVTITQVALAAGYDSLDAFSRAFRAQFKVLPSAYRRNDGPLEQARRYSIGQPLFYHLAPDVPPIDVQIRSFAPMWVATLRYTGPYDDCYPAWETLMAAMQTQGLLTVDTFACAVSHDNPDITPVDKCRMEVCLSLPPGMTANTLAVRNLLQDKRIYLRVIGSNSDYAVIEVNGPYSLLHPAYRSLYWQWLPQSGREPDDDPGFEVYYNSPQSTEPQDLRTGIFIPLLMG
ncbi:hypothetical protein Z042_14810 [Chania multitudinisentens RB-25]|uniref:HTH araC/xylS-type domain-containing protein n=1 Tax=Chania multitudinisentens RB-25 TaxID=1441930 RepID=W0LFM0_9GAMM|nr:GyrI-like domain-containing protein [Chania multitudinisentens]AHG20735.1 hypothetical protein Z042_14810 [Chania multitudinisentens RB-25]